MFAAHICSKAAPKKLNLQALKGHGKSPEQGKKAKKWEKSGKKGHYTGAKPGFGLRSFVPGAPAQHQRADGNSAEFFSC